MRKAPKHFSLSDSTLMLLDEKFQNKPRQMSQWVDEMLLSILKNQYNNNNIEVEIKLLSEQLEQEEKNYFLAKAKVQQIKQRLDTLQNQKQKEVQLKLERVSSQEQIKQKMKYHYSFNCVCCDREINKDNQGFKLFSENDIDYHVHWNCARDNSLTMQNKLVEWKNAQFVQIKMRWGV